MNDAPDKALLPAGVRDALPPEAAQEADTAERLVASFAAWGFARVKPPLVEFEENLLSGSGQAMASDAFRLQDPISQRMMAIRPDMTLQVARIATKRLPHAARPLRLAYEGQVLRVKSSQLRPGRQFGQVGAELIGSTDPAADVEVIAMAVEALESLGIEGLSVDIGLPTLAPLVIKGAELDEHQAQRLHTALNRKDPTDILAMSEVLGTARAETLAAMIGAVGPVDAAMSKLDQITLDGEAAENCRQLKAVIAGLKAARPDLTLTLDPVESRGFEYHTGVTYAVFASTVTGDLGRGGRYEAGSNGQVEPATGLTLFMDTVLKALPTPETPKRVLIGPGVDADTARTLRAEGWVTVRQIGEASLDGEAARMNCDHVCEDGQVRSRK